MTARRPRSIAAALGLAWLLAVLAGETAVAAGTPARPDAAARAPGEPALEVIRLGPVDVEDRRRIDLAEATVDLAGRAWSFGRGDAVSVLIRPLGQRPWNRAAEEVVPAGGLFQIAGIRFAEAGSYELVACLAHARDLPAGGDGDAAAAEGCGKRALATSRILLVRVGVRPPPLAAERPALEVLQVGGVTLDPRAVTPVPPIGEVVLRAGGLAAGTRVYLAILAPSSDRCYLHGPARPGPQPDLFTLQGVPLEVPGDPRTARLELVAVASPEILAGPMSLQTLRQREARTSPAAEVVVDQKGEAGNSPRVPQLAVTRIGDQAPPATPSAAALEIEPGDAIEIAEYERVPEGERIWILTRPRGSSFWLAQGPAVPRGGRAPADPRQGPPLVTWLWPSARFERAGARPGEKRRSRHREEFEVLAVLSTATLPDGWIDSAALSGNFIQTVSQLVRVSVPPGEPFSDFRISITRVGGQDADPEAETPVGAAERLEAASGEALPPSMRLYLARHKVGDSLWTLVEAISRGKTHLVPAISFVNPHPEEGARYQLLAIATRGVLPSGQLGYDDLVHAAVASSEVITVRYEPERPSGLVSRLAHPRPGVAGPSAVTERRRIMSFPWTRVPWSLLGGALLVLALLILLEWLLGVVSKVARSGADRIARGLEASRSWFTRPPVINPAQLLLGSAILAFVLYALVRYYLPLYGEAVAELTGLPSKKSFGLAIWLVMFTALAGIFLELSTARAIPAGAAGTVSRSRDRGGLWLPFFLGIGLLVLMLFEGFLYFAFLSKTVGGLVALLGGIAFLLIAFMEAMAFFFVTRLLIGPAESLSRLARLPFVVCELCLRGVAKVFDSIPKRRPPEVPPKEEQR
jgi:hypothetical protein